MGDSHHMINIVAYPPSTIIHLPVIRMGHGLEPCIYHAPITV